MTTPAPVPAPVPTAPPAAPAKPGPLSEVASWFHRGETDAAKIAASATAMLTDHAGQALDVGGDFLALLKLIDPADAPLIAAAQALLPKVIMMAEHALSDVRTLLPAASQPPA